MFFRIAVFLVLFVSVGLGVVSAQEDSPAMTYDKALACVEAVLPAEMYSTNEYLPSAEDLADTTPFEGEVAHLSVGMPWILNDEEAAFYNAVELGFYAQEGLEVELVPGGPGINQLLILGGGATDIAVPAAGGDIPFAWASPTPLQSVAVGTINKLGQYAYLTTDPELIGKELTPQDLIGTTVYTQQGGALYTQILLDQYEIPRDSVTIIDTAGFSPDAIMTNPEGVRKVVYTAWLSNQPRALEAEGFEWNALRYGDWAHTEYTDVIAVLAETLETEEGRDLVQRFMRATYRGLDYLVENPEESADIAVEYAVDADLTVDQALWRFGIQEDQNLIVGNDDLGLMAMDPAVWNQTVATMLQYGQLELQCN